MWKNGELEDYIQWRDEDGNIINASDGGIIYVDGFYYWYGMALRGLPFASGGKGGQTTTQGVVMYSSADLVHWKKEGIILPCSSEPASELYGPLRFERPKIIYNEKTGQYVLWCHYVKYPGDYGTTEETAEAGGTCCGVSGWLLFHDNVRTFRMGLQSGKVFSSEKYIWSMGGYGGSLCR